MPLRKNNEYLKRFIEILKSFTIRITLPRPLFLGKGNALIIPIINF